MSFSYWHKHNVILTFFNIDELRCFNILYLILTFAIQMIMSTIMLIGTGN
jgi:hypothetical protein